ncbi:DUF2169 domain-containing protein [Desulfococcaceae bacterium HSG9]|nr:DUF2169 domain-containing protein [Desulfococcaceae bacterium HSG9]
MWQLTNNTPFAAERTFVRDKDGAEVWVVAVKGTFIINKNGTNKLADDQVDVCAVPEYFGEPGQSGLRYESDLVLTKPGTDIILLGHAYAPQGNPLPWIDVIIKVGSLSKILRVFGDRCWKKGLMSLNITEPEPFVKMPIIYERAFGGADQKSDNPEEHGWERRNPVGTGFAMKNEYLVGQMLPNIEYPSDEIKSWKDRPAPAGFGPIPGAWEPRIDFAGTYDKKWEQERLPLLPSDFDERYYQSAPADQQAPGYLKGGESVELHHLTPDGMLRFTLPDVGNDLLFITNFGNKTVEHTANLHTVVFEPDYPRFIMIWHTSLLCHNWDTKLIETRIT